MKPLWIPLETKNLNIERFRLHLEEKFDIHFPSYESLHQFSVARASDFWRELSEFVRIDWQKKGGDEVFIESKEGHEFLDCKWFQGYELNYTRNVFAAKTDERMPALISINEDLAQIVSLSWTELEEYVQGLAFYLHEQGFRKGDVAAGIVSNSHLTIVAMLAVAQLGGVWASCSPDFGEAAILDRMLQIRPKVLFATSRYLYNGKIFDISSTLNAVLRALAGIDQLFILQHLSNQSFDIENLEFSKNKILLTSKMDRALLNKVRMEYTSCSFNDPLFIMFSSGTTGKPKCIIHGVGRVLLQHKKELMLHGDIRPQDRHLFYTTCGWMMWNWLVSSLSLGCTVVCFDGSPLAMNGEILWEIVQKHQISHLGLSPRLLQSFKLSKLRQQADQIPTLRTIFSTGAPLSEDLFEYVYKDIKQDVHLASISGGTDLISCFMLGNPAMPVYSGEIQCLGLGMAVEAWDEKGVPVKNEKGELVCTRPFVSMPLGLLGDKDNQKYKDTYFNFYSKKSVWRHGDFIQFTDHGGIVMYGRSDATLNPSGVRFGTAELYRVTEQMPEVLDALAFSFEQADHTEQVVLLIKSKNISWGDDLTQQLKTLIKHQLSPRHVPWKIILVKDIPYTRNGKKVEIAVKQFFAKLEVKNLDALSNPEVFEEYKEYLKQLYPPT